jgi:hypothetical protein
MLDRPGDVFADARKLLQRGSPVLVDQFFHRLIEAHQGRGSQTVGANAKQIVVPFPQFASVLLKSAGNVEVAHGGSSTELYARSRFKR